MDDSFIHNKKVVDPSGGSNQRRVRDYNERLVLSLVRRHGMLSKSEIARRTGLSAQTVSVIMRALEQDGLLLKGEPRRGKVGQPSVPMSLNPEGAFSVGLKIGRRSADLVLVDFIGRQRGTLSISYPYPKLHSVLDFAESGIEQLACSLTDEKRARIAGIGVAMPFELWNWAEKIDAPKAQMKDWETVDFGECLHRRIDYPVFIQNDGTSACGAELVFGLGAKMSDFIYFFIGTFIGGGVVLNHAVYPGRSENAGAIGSMPVTNTDGTASQLIDHASLLELENQLKPKDGKRNSALDAALSDWDELGPPLDNWINQTARHLAFAIISASSVIDFLAAIVDGDFPSNIKKRLIAQIEKEVSKLNLQGIEAPQIHAGIVGRDARTIGAASLPLFSRYLLDQSVLFKDLN